MICHEYFMCLSPQKVTTNYETEKFFPSFSNISHKTMDLRIKRLGFVQVVGLGYWIGFGKDKGNLEGNKWCQLLPCGFPPRIPAGTEGLCLTPNPHGYADSIIYCTLGKAFCNVSAVSFVSLCTGQMGDNPSEAQPTPLKSLLPLPKP